MSLKPYSEMKPSGIAWLGDIPKHWEVTPLKYLVKINNEALTEQTSAERMIEYIDIGSVDNIGVISATQMYEFANAPSRARRVVKSGDVLVSTVRTYLKAIAFCPNAHNDLICSTGFAVLTSRHSIFPKFLFYWTRSDYFVAEVVSRSNGVSYPAINADDIGNLPLPLFTYAEQQAIAAYLDRKTAQIDAIVREKEEQIRLLAEQRQAVISHAVTRGLDPNAPRKPSGIAWLGDIPAHWIETRLKYISILLQTGPFGSQLHSEDYIVDGIPIVNPANIENGRLIPNMNNTVDEATFQNLIRHRLEIGDIVFGRRGEMGRCAMVTVNEQGWLCGTGSLLMRINPSSCLPIFLCFLFGTQGVKDWLLLQSVGSTMDNLNTGILADFAIAIPPISEQEAIVNYLGAETARLDGILQTLTQQIGELRDYRQALISAVVTGKVDVREAGESAGGEAGD